MDENILTRINVICITHKTKIRIRTWIDFIDSIEFGCNLWINEKS